MASPIASFTLDSHVKSDDHDDEPHTPWLLIVVVAVIGIGYLFPFSALTQPVDYWSVLFPDFNIEFAITCVFLYTNLVTLGLLVAFGSTDISYTRRIVGGFIGQFLVLVFVPLEYHLFSTETAHKVAILAATAVAAIATAFLDSCVIALVATYPLSAQAALQFGVGFSTLIGAMYRDLTKLAFPTTAVVTSSALYFYIGAVTVGVCIGAYFVLLRLRASHTVGCGHESGLLHDSVAEGPNRWSVLRKCVRNQVQISLLFFTTLCLWPPLVTEMRSFNCPELQATGWWPLLLLTSFAVADCLGRLLVSYRCGLTKDNIWKPIVVRMLLVPCIVLTVRGVWFTHDAWSVLFVTLLGFTNGYHGSLAIIFVSDCVEATERGIAGTFTGFFLSAGLVLGSTVGLLLPK
ncbi:Aste57867_9346 [Aphanomyces stellatus]|uniref:Aste57867_9346 protein n=1 Tax=Aphanomyces stellatus TaxID=120398 RepID=A0A485KMN0_9STRA|nr:hypothetical protein As57867_009310 [Aphanomyces stellatus]VFT86227.1 Aste57867_9346 [Aphanomyces stellatus]